MKIENNGPKGRFLQIDDNILMVSIIYFFVADLRLL